MDKTPRVFCLNIAALIERSTVSLNHGGDGFKINVPFPEREWREFGNQLPLVVTSPSLLALNFADIISAVMFKGAAVVESELLLCRFEGAKRKGFKQKVWQAVKAKNKQAYEFAFFIPLP